MLLCCCPLLPLFIHGKLGTSKIDCRDKVSKKPGLLTFFKREIGYAASCLVSFAIFNKFFKVTLKWLCSSLLCYNNFCAKTNTGDKMKYHKFFNNTEAQQKNTEENTS